MAGIKDANVIDLVAQGADGEYMVVMVETRPWGASPDQPEQLKAKINAYAGYILDGTLARQYPETAGKAVRIRLDCPERPHGDIGMIIEWAMRQLREHGIRFEVNAQAT
jgi:hypothetical protein